MSQKDVFISHAVKDKPLADAFVDFLETAIGISSNDIFCSSLEGMTIPSGKNFIDYIREQIQEPKAVILLLSPNYYESNFCLCELGATWAMSHEFCPILVPPLKYQDIKEVVTAIQLTKIDDETDLSEFRDRLIKILNISSKPTAKWEAKRNAFLKALPQILSNLPTPQAISFSEHEKLQKDYDESVTEMEKYDKKISSLEKAVEELKKCKDSEEANKVLLKDLPEAKKFKQLIGSAKASLRPFSRIVVTALYRSFTDTTELVLRGFEDRYDIQAAEEAKDEGYLSKNDPDETVYYPNESDPTINKVLNALYELRTFIEDKASEGFLEALLEEAGCEISLSNRRFWEHYLE